MGWPLWAAVAAGVAALGFAAGLAVASARSERNPGRDDPLPPQPEPETRHAVELPSASPRRVLVVDDDPGLRLLLRTTLALDDLEVEEASGAVEAEALARFRRPAAAVVDVGLIDGNGLELCRKLKRMGRDEPPTVILLTGAETSEAEAEEAGADGLLRKPFSPLELLGLLDRLSSGHGGDPAEPADSDAGQLLLYARDMSRLLDIERRQRRLLQQAYRQTTGALADALEAKDSHTGRHAVRVQRYALEIARTLDRNLLDDPSLEHGFLLHDIGKIAVPDAILNKPGPLTAGERELVQQHPVIGAEILEGVVLLQGEGIQVVRSHHERWDGEGYPEGRAGEEIALGARVFAIADTLDAMTTDRPYRGSQRWEAAIDEILGESGRQFDPRVVGAFAACEPRLRRLHGEFAFAAA
jgi:cyclic di-GMP phosphodiesterase